MFEEESYDGSSALDRRLLRQSMVATVGDEVTFRYLPPKSSDLSFYDATKLFDAMSFNMWQHGGILNCHITIAWRTLGVPVTDHEHAAALLGEYLNRCQKWATAGLLPRRCSLKNPRWRTRTGKGFRFSYLYVHEHGTEHGFHSHVLCHVPQHAFPSFRAWTREILPQLTGHPGTKKSVKVIPARERSESSTVERQWKWFAYLMKQLNPQEHVGNRAAGQSLPLRTVLKVYTHRSALEVTCRKLTGTSHDIGRKAQKAAGYNPSWLGWSRRDRWYLGDELTAWRQRQEQKEVERLRIQWERMFAVLNRGSPPR